MNLIDLLRKTITISSMALPLALNSCMEENYTPEATLEINPKSGEAPLTVNMRLTGFDENGIGDIVLEQLNYRIYYYK